MRQNVLLSWSSGKDSAWSLQVLREDPGVRVVGLLTTFNEAADRVAMHAVRRALVESQAAAAGLPLLPAMLPWPCPNSAYEAAMQAALGRARAELHIDAVAFGDLFLEDIRRYREEKMAGTGLECLFPLWGEPTAALARTMIEAGLKARLTCVDPAQCPPRFAGRPFDLALLDDLPEAVDPCGENGEFHSFVHDGPMFDRAIDVTPGDIVERDGFVFADVVPA
ncbi:MAG: ATP-binding protein [Pseudomonadota bacterium]